MTPTTLAETILRDVPRHDAYDVMMTLDGHPLPGGCAFGKWVRHADVLAALSRALDHAIAERAGEVVADLRDDAQWGTPICTKAADLITALLAQNAALRAERDALAAQVAEVTSDRAYIIGANDGWEAAVEQSVATPAAAAMLARAEAAEAEVEKLRGALEGLEKASSEVSRRGAETGPQWSKLTIAILQARAALTETATTEELK